LIVSRDRYTNYNALLIMSSNEKTPGHLRTTVTKRTRQNLEVTRLWNKAPIPFERAVASFVHR